MLWAFVNTFSPPFLFQQPSLSLLIHFRSSNDISAFVLFAQFAGKVAESREGTRYLVVLRGAFSFMPFSKKSGSCKQILANPRLSGTWLWSVNACAGCVHAETEWLVPVLGNTKWLSPPAGSVSMLSCLILFLH